MIITIGRQLGSGGLEIGRLLAERLNLAFYDKELLTEAARHSGICPECFQQVDEQAKRTFGGVGIFGMRFPFVGDGNTSYNSMISGDNLFLIQSETIVKLAENEQGAVFVGRCADYVLRDEKNVFRIFVYGDLDHRQARVLERHPEIKPTQVVDVINKTDKRRATYYNFYTGNKWGKFDNYDMLINSSTLGIEGSVQLICASIRKLIEE